MGPCALPSARPLTVRRVRAQPKVRFICERFVPHFVSECGCSESQVYIWWDFLSVSQSDHAMQKRQIECLPIFVAMSDAVCAARGRGLLRQEGDRSVRRGDAEQGVAQADELPTHGNEFRPSSYDDRLPRRRRRIGVQY